MFEAWSFQYAVKLTLFPDSPVYDCVFNPFYGDIFEKHEHKIPPLGICLKPHLNNFDLESKFATVYTDESKDCDKVSSAPLTSVASIFVAEAKAIILALQLITTSEKSKIIICSDSYHVFKQYNIPKLKPVHSLNHLRNENFFIFQ